MTWAALRARWPRRIAIALAALLGLMLLAWWAVPGIVQSQAQTRLGALLGRTVTIGAVEFRPWSVELTVRDLAIAAAPGAAASAPPLLQVARLHADVSLASLWRGAPVLQALDIDAPRLALTRTAAGRYDIDDLVERLRPAPGAPAGEPLRFALYNLRLRDGELRFDDRPVGRVHRVEALTLTLPFVSDLPAAAEVTVEPRLAFRVGATTFDSDAQARPFAADRAAELKFVFDDLDLEPYLGYLPEALPLRLQRARLSVDLRLRFAREGGRSRLVLQGRTQARELAIAEPSGAPLLAWRSLALDWQDVQPLERRLNFGALRVDGLQLRLRRDAGGRLNLQTLFTAPPSAVVAAAPAASAASAPAAVAGWQVALQGVEFDDATLHWDDASTRPAAALALSGLRLTLQQPRWPLVQAVPVTLSAGLRAAGAASAPELGRVQIDGSAGDRDAALRVTLSDLALEAFAPYLAQAVTPRLAGRARAQGRIDWSASADAPRLQLQLDELALDGLRVAEGSGKAATEVATLRRLQIADAEVDLLRSAVRVGDLQIGQPALSLVRRDDGVWNLQRWSVPAPSTADAAPAPWSLRVQRASIDDGTLRVSDALAREAGATGPLQFVASGLRVGLQDLAWPAVPRAAPARLTLGLRIAAGERPNARAPAGLLEWSGQFAPDPLLLRGRLRTERLPVALFEPYLALATGAALPVDLLRLDAGFRGDLALALAPAGAKLQLAGDAVLAGLSLHTRPEPGSLAASEELLGWNGLALTGLRVALDPPARPRIDIAEAALSDFYSRLVITEQGRFNLRDVAAAPPASASAPAGVAPPAPAASAPAGGGLPLDIAVGGVRLANGRVDFSDRFVRPNYSATLSELNGRLGAFRSGTREMATLDLRGRAAGTALLEISGQLNPTAEPLALDIRARATDLELAPLSPYAGKYAGYAIERGKLSMDVSYRIDPDGRLEAKNQVVLNQLSFGDRIDSPDATKLPVLLAVALLKDRNGVIDINLPISGSINDPQFSVFGLVLRVIGNLLVKAITAPFALLAGGGGDDLSVVEFLPGTARLADAGRAALDKVAQALADRPSLRMTVTGAADPVSEREAFQRAALETRLLAERRRELLRAGASGDAETPALAADERLRLLRDIYRAADIPNKPRNAIGLQRELSGPEMEALLLPRTVVGVDAMRELALQRGLAVRDALIAKGLPSERLFVAAPRLRASGEDDAAWTPRVQLTLSTQ